jgi:CRISPR-associated protein Csy2
MAETLINASGVLVLPRLRVQNANAMAGPLSWGFPAPTAFTGFAHALQRHLSEQLPLGFGGVGIVCHGFEAQTSQPAGKRTHVFCLTRNPVGKDGSAPSLVEEGRVHLDVTLLLPVRDKISDDYDGQQLAAKALDIVQGMRLAGGSILALRRNKAQTWWGLAENFNDQRLIYQKLRRRLLPGFALVPRGDLLQKHLADMQTKAPANALDALLDLCRINIEPGPALPDEPDKAEWQIGKRRPGWLVPLPVGYAGISELYQPGEVANARDGETPFRFVEALYSLGEWVSPHRIESLRACQKISCTS